MKWLQEQDDRDVVLGAWDQKGARDLLQQAFDSDLCSSNVNIIASEIGSQGFTKVNLCTQDALDAHLKRQNAPEKDDLELYVIPQSHSRGPLTITSDGLDTILDHVKAMPSFSDIVTAFAPDGSDCYISRAGLHFSSSRDERSVLELCCNLKHVEANKSGREGIYAWSIRQMGFYQSFPLAMGREKILLVNPSVRVWEQIKTTTIPRDRGSAHWTTMPAILCGSLTANWAAYSAALHAAVMDIRYDAVFASVQTRGKTALPIDKLKEAMLYDGMLQQASHVLHNNVVSLKALGEESLKRQARYSTSEDDVAQYERFRCVLDDTIRSLSFTKGQLELCSQRLEGSSIRDIVTLQNTYSMEEMSKQTMVMTEKSVDEARSVRIIAIVTLLYLPPTFTATFLGMNYFTVNDVTGYGTFTLTVDPTGWFYLALTLPLMVVTLSLWLLWQWYRRRSRKARQERTAADRAQRAFWNDPEKGAANSNTGP